MKKLRFFFLLTCLILSFTAFTPLAQVQAQNSQIDDLDNAVDDLEAEVQVIQFQQEVILEANRQQIEQMNQAFGNVTTFGGIIGAVFTFITVFVVFRETRLTSNIDGVMGAVRSLLEFEAEMTKRRKELEKAGDIFKPDAAVALINERAGQLKRDVNRRDLYEQSSKITDLAQRVRFIEYTFGYRGLADEPWVEYLVGLAAIIENRIDEAENRLQHAIKIIEERQIEWPDPLTAPMCLYFLGILRKNLNQQQEAIQCFKQIKWPSGDKEVRTPVELAEVIALDTKYQAAENDRYIIEADKAIKDAEPRRDQQANIETMKVRMDLLKGNYAFVNGIWEVALGHYEDALKINKDYPYALLSIGITKMMLDEETGQDKLEQAYSNIIKNRKHIKHPERRGKILLIGSALIAARLHNTLEVPIELSIPMENEIQELEAINRGSKHTFHIFSPLSKQMVDLDTFIDHTDAPKDVLNSLFPSQK